MSAMQRIASKLISQMKPGSRFTKGDLPVLSVAQIGKAIKSQLSPDLRTSIKSSTSKNMKRFGGGLHSETLY